MLKCVKKGVVCNIPRAFLLVKLTMLALHRKLTPAQPYMTNFKLPPPKNTSKADIYTIINTDPF